MGLELRMRALCNKLNGGVIYTESWTHGVIPTGPVDQWT